MSNSNVWPNYGLGPRESIFAIGVVRVTFVELEAIFSLMFATIFDVSSEIAEMMFTQMENEASLKLMKKKLMSNPRSDKAKDLTNCFIDGFEICLRA